MGDRVQPILAFDHGSERSPFMSAVTFGVSAMQMQEITPVTPVYPLRAQNS